VSVKNIHERVFNASIDKVGELIDNLASKDDKLWPRDRWPAMKFDRALEVGAKGGHGPIRYEVETYIPGHSVQFRFIKPNGFIGYHRFEIEQQEKNEVILRHTIDMKTVGTDKISWLFFIRPLHDALLEDALDNAEIYIGNQPKNRKWSLWVKFVRWAMTRN
jgi:hypothetical protein